MCIDNHDCDCTLRHMSNYRSLDYTEMAGKFKALSNPIRLKIFMELTRCCAPGDVCEVQRCIGDLAGLVDVAPSTLSHHMKELNRAGLVDMQRSGKNILCKVDVKVLEALSDYFHESV